MQLHINEQYIGLMRGNSMCGRGMLAVTASAERKETYFGWHARAAVGVDAARPVSQLASLVTLRAHA
jgi:hypothetical protein